MRSLKESILSTTKVGKFDPWNALKAKHTHPANRSALITAIREAVKLKGNDVDLNWIDTSRIENMFFLFQGLQFNGDISKWDVSNAEIIYGMFRKSKFSGDISKWDVSNVKDMSYMVWNSPLAKNPPKWYRGGKG